MKSPARKSTKTQIQTQILHYHKITLHEVLKREFFFSFLLDIRREARERKRRQGQRRDRGRTKRARESGE